MHTIVDCIVYCETLHNITQRSNNVVTTYVVIWLFLTIKKMTGTIKEQPLGKQATLICDVFLHMVKVQLKKAKNDLENFQDHVFYIIMQFLKRQTHSEIQKTFGYIYRSNY